MVVGSLCGGSLCGGSLCGGCAMWWLGHCVVGHCVVGHSVVGHCVVGDCVVGAQCGGYAMVVNVPNPARVNAFYLRINNIRYHGNGEQALENYS